MKKQRWILLCAVLLCLIIPTASMAETTLVFICMNMENGVMGVVEEGYYVTNDAYYRAGPPAEDATGYAWYHDGILTLNNFVAEFIEADYGDLTIELIGDNRLTTENDALDADDGDLTIQGSGSLRLESTYDADGIDITDGDLIIKGGDITIIAKDHGIEIDKTDEYGTEGVGQFFMSGGTLTITAGDEGIDAEEGITVSGGSITITAVDQGMDSSESLLISGGTVDITAIEDDGIEASDQLTITGGRVTVRSYCCGLYADDILVTGGDLSIRTSMGGGRAFSALNSLMVAQAEEYSVVRLTDKWDNDRLTLVDADGRPLPTYRWKESVPRTGDATSVAFLCALCMLSLAGAWVLLRRRSA